MTVLLSIKPEFAEKIFNGTKKFEFRKSLFKRRDIQTVIVYASFPIQKIIGEFQIEEVLNDYVEKIWEKTHQHSGISKEFYQKYFRHKEKAYAIKVGKVKKYRKQKTLKDFKLDFAPQSFVYINKSLL